MNYNEKLFSFDNLFLNEPIKIPSGKLYQISELSLRMGSEIPPHSQYCDEITYVISGSATFYCNDDSFNIKAGQFHFIKKGNKHRIVTSENENLRYICIGMDVDQSDISVNNFLTALGNSKTFIADDNGTGKSLSEFLVREFYDWDSHSIGMVSSFITQLFITLTRCLEGKSFTCYQNGNIKSAGYAMYKLLRYLDREYMQIQSIKTDVAEKLLYSEYYLSHLFKEKMGMTIKEYLIKKKVVHATQLLATTDLSIDKIAETLSFSNAHSFRRAFKETIGINPLEYKKRLSENK